jgi:2-dehydropantoate 2-reductase
MPQDLTGMTRICVFGAGAIGGLIAARLALKGDAEVSLVARGAHLEAIRAKGLVLRQSGETHSIKVTATGQTAGLGAQDIIILTLKTHATAAAIDQIMPLIGGDTVILYAQNGIPWWYFHESGGPFEGRKLESVDPGGLIWKRLGPEHALGAVIWMAADVEAPGVIVHGFGDRMPIGEPSGIITDRAQRVSAILNSAGIKSPVKTDLRNEIWLKLWGNLSFNPVSVLTNGTLGELASDSATRRVIAAMMEESRSVGEALGIAFPVGIDERIDMAMKAGAHRTSMLQDVDAGRPTELEAVLGVVIELARLTGKNTPSLQMVYDLVKFRTRTQPV